MGTFLGHPCGRRLYAFRALACSRPGSRSATRQETGVAAERA
jgi:hypothetical protein